MTTVAISPMIVFQSTLRRTERLGIKNWYTEKERYFNPRSDERSDNYTDELGDNVSISIHAPTNGATSCQYQEETGTRNFNPRSDERSDSLHWVV